jgi:hypothetical protein
MFVKEKVCSLCHSAPFESVPGIIVVHTVLHVKFVDGFPQKGGVKHFSPGEIMTNRCLHADNLCLRFGSYCQVAEHVEPRNSLALHTRAAILLGSLGNLSGGQIFLALDTGHTIVWHQWMVLPMPPVVITNVTPIGKAEPSILTFTDWHDCEIGDHPQDFDPGGDDDDNSASELILDVIPEVDPAPEDDAKLPEVDTDFDAKPTGVEVGWDYALQELNEVDGLKQHKTYTAPTWEPSSEPTIVPTEDPAPPSQGMAAHNTRARKPPEKYIPAMKGDKYAVTMIQIAASLKGSKNSMAMAQMSVKLMSLGAHRQADVVGVIWHSYP